MFQGLRALFPPNKSAHLGSELDMVHTYHLLVGGNHFRPLSQSSVLISHQCHPEWTAHLWVHLQCEHNHELPSTHSVTEPIIETQERLGPQHDQHLGQQTRTISHISTLYCKVLTLIGRDGYLEEKYCEESECRCLSQHLLAHDGEPPPSCNFTARSASQREAT